MKVTVDGREFALTLSGARGNAMPKKNPISILVNGVASSDCRVTSNKGWAKSPEVVLEYIWIPIDGKGYYVTLDYGVAAASYAGKDFVVAEGSGPKPPKRVGLETREAERIAKFSATWKARDAAVVAAPVVEAPKPEPVAEPAPLSKSERKRLARAGK